MSAMSKIIQAEAGVFEYSQQKTRW